MANKHIFHMLYSLFIFWTLISLQAETAVKSLRQTSPQRLQPSSTSINFVSFSYSPMATWMVQTLYIVNVNTVNWTSKHVDVWFFFPQLGVKVEKIWNHHLVLLLCQIAHLASSICILDGFDQILVHSPQARALRITKLTPKKMRPISCGEKANASNSNIFSYFFPYDCASIKFDESAGFSGKWHDVWKVTLGFGTIFNWTMREEG